MAQAGAFFARKGARIVCIANEGHVCGPVLAGSKSNGGQILILADDAFVVPRAFAEAEIERISDKAMRSKRAGQLSDAFVGLPGSLGSAMSLFDSWVKSGATGGSIPVALLNRNRAFESLRGFAADVASVRVRDLDRKLIFADNLDDLWRGVQKATGTSGG